MSRGSVWCVPPFATRRPCLINPAPEPAGLRPGACPAARAGRVIPLPKAGAAVHHAVMDETLIALLAERAGLARFQAAFAEDLRSAIATAMVMRAALPAGDEAAAAPWPAMRVRPAE